jgi:hypothetical protein
MVSMREGAERLDKLRLSETRFFDQMYHEGFQMLGQLEQGSSDSGHPFQPPPCSKQHQVGREPHREA